MLHHVLESMEACSCLDLAQLDTGVPAAPLSLHSRVPVTALGSSRLLVLFDTDRSVHELWYLLHSPSCPGLCSESLLHSHGSESGAPSLSVASPLALPSTARKRSRASFGSDGSTATPPSGSMGPERFAGLPGKPGSSHAGGQRILGLLSAVRDEAAAEEAAAPHPIHDSSTIVDRLVAPACLVRVVPNLLQGVDQPSSPAAAATLVASPTATGMWGAPQATRLSTCGVGVLLGWKAPQWCAGIHLKHVPPVVGVGAGKQGSARTLLELQAALHVAVGDISSKPLPPPALTWSSQLHAAQGLCLPGLPLLAHCSEVLSSSVSTIERSEKDMAHLGAFHSLIAIDRPLWPFGCSFPSAGPLSTLLSRLAPCSAADTGAGEPLNGLLRHQLSRGWDDSETHREFLLSSETFLLLPVVADPTSLLFTAVLPDLCPAAEVVQVLLEGVSRHVHTDFIDCVVHARDTASSPGSGPLAVDVGALPSAPVSLKVATAAARFVRGSLTEPTCTEESASAALSRVAASLLRLFQLACEGATRGTPLAAAGALVVLLSDVQTLPPALQAGVIQANTLLGEKASMLPASPSAPLCLGTFGGPAPLEVQPLHPLAAERVRRGVLLALNVAQGRNVGALGNSLGQSCVLFPLPLLPVATALLAGSRPSWPQRLGVPLSVALFAQTHDGSVGEIDWDECGLQRASGAIRDFYASIASACDLEDVAATLRSASTSRPSKVCHTAGELLQALGLSMPHRSDLRAILDSELLPPPLTGAWLGESHVLGTSLHRQEGGQGEHTARRAPLDAFQDDLADVPALLATAGSCGSAPDTSWSLGDLDGLVGLCVKAAELYPADRRFEHVAQALQSSRMQHLLQHPSFTSGTDHARIKAVQVHVFRLAIRTLMSSLGRGGLTLGSTFIDAGHLFPTPPVTVAVRQGPGGAVVNMDIRGIVQARQDALDLALFHNGVAAGLRAAARSRLPGGQAALRSWVRAHQPSTPTAGHGGLLLGFGLQGLLSCLRLPDLFQVLREGHPETSIGALLGLAASHFGTANASVSKALTLHLPHALPSGAADFALSPSLQASSIVGLGLLYAGTQQKLVAEFALREVTASPAADAFADAPPASQRCDEAYALAAGWTLGMVHASTPRVAGGLSEQERAASDSLLQSLLPSLAGQALAQASTRSESASSNVAGQASRQPEVSRDLRTADPSRTVPASITAIALAFLGTHSSAAASALALPSTLSRLDALRPDYILMRVAARSLVLWGSVEPSVAWVLNQVPGIVLSAVHAGLASAQASGGTQDLLGQLAALMAGGEQAQPPSSRPSDTTGATASAQVSSGEAGLEHCVSGGTSSPARHMLPESAWRALDALAVNQIHVSCLAGACWALGMRFAGTINPAAKQTLLHFLRLFLAMQASGSPAAFDPVVASMGGVEILANPGQNALNCTTASFLAPDTHTLTNAISTTCCALGMVMAGSMDEDCLRTVLLVRNSCSEVVASGSHAACSLALGWLGIGGGRASFRRDPASVGCLWLASFPAWPRDQADNCLHHQAWRHLYALATQQRTLRVLSASTHKAVPCKVRVQLQPEARAELGLGSSLSMLLEAPCILPDPSLISSLQAMGSGWLGREWSAATMLCHSRESRLPHGLTVFVPAEGPAPCREWSGLKAALTCAPAMLPIARRLVAAVAKNSSTEVGQWLHSVNALAVSRVRALAVAALAELKQGLSGHSVGMPHATELAQWIEPCLLSDLLSLATPGQLEDWHTLSQWVSQLEDPRGMRIHNSARSVVALVGAG